MIEAKNLRKKYAPKKGVVVNALDDVSLCLPDTGMVFILGKSGSGKSTLLNVLGGLDTFDSGEIIIKGQSSMGFKQSHFDSYRNTYVGFIFQEYNILEEFTVGANIALAIELQGRKATNEEINSILKEVDLDGLGSRKPNELSGGQKQRVAIARALVKKPEIIMADEPTGALDSNTGRQVFDTLKELSKSKLVLIVSHDREFSELYADRIIELADGKIISDVEYDKAATESEEEPNLSYSGKEITIKEGYELTEADIVAINQYIKKIKSGATLVVNDKRREKIFKKTDETKIPKRSSEGFKLIKSRLSIKNAFKLGSSGLKHKKVRLVFTIILSFIAFSLFGLADTIASYDSIKTCTESLLDSSIDYASFSKGVKRTYGDGDDDFYWETWNALVSDEEIKQLNQETGLDYIGVVGGNNYYISFSNQVAQSTDSTMDYSRVYPSRFSGIASITNDDLSRFGYSLTGKLPENDDEIVITKYVYEYFETVGYVDKDKEGELEVVDINSKNDLIGKTLAISGSAFNGNPYKIVGILDTGFDASRYESLADSTANGGIFDYALQSELSSTQNYSLHAVVFTTKSFESKFIDYSNSYSSNMQNGGLTIYGFKKQELGLDNDDNITFRGWPNTIKSLSDVKNVAWIGNKLDSLTNDQIIVSPQFLENKLYEILNNSNSDAKEPETLTFNGFEKTIDSNYPSAYNGFPENIFRNFYKSVAIKYVYEDMPNNFANIEKEIKKVNSSFNLNNYKYDETHYNFLDIVNEFYNTCAFSASRPYDNDYIKSYYNDLMSRYSSVKSTMIDIDTYLSYIKTLPNNGGYFCCADSLEARSFIDNHKRISSRAYAIENPEKAISFYNSDSNGDFASSLTKNVVERYSNHLNEIWGEELQKEADFVSFDGLFVTNFAVKSGLLDNIAMNYYLHTDNESHESFDIEIVGVSSDLLQSESLIVSDEIYMALTGGGNGIYSCAVAPMPKDQKGVGDLVKFYYQDTHFTNDKKFFLKNSVTEELNMIDGILETLGQVFLYIGLGFAVFASLMLSNFIATSVSHKKQEIGILRAIGSRSNDVFMIFFAESFIIAMINFALSVVTTGAVVYILNGVFRNDIGLLITFLTFGVRQIALLLGVSLLVALIATFLPVKKIASMKPIDAIKNRK